MELPVQRLGLHHRRRASPELTWEPPQLAFETDDFIETKGRSYDVTPGGQRLLVVKRTRPPGRDAIRVVTHRLDELQRYEE